MDANVVFRAYMVARDKMERDLANRAEYAFEIPVTPASALFGIAVADDMDARQWQKHNRQAHAFETRMRHIVNSVDGITYTENVGKTRIRGR